MASLDDVVTAANNINKNLSQLIQSLNATLLTVGANPSASVGLSAVNGSSTTFMRSDAAPALDQTIAPTWTGAQTFSNAVTFSNTVVQSGTYTQLGSSSQLRWSTDLILTRSAAATLQVGAVTGSSAATAQTLQIQGSTGNSAAAATFTIAGSDQTGTTTTGGTLKLRGGNGTSAGGTVEIWTSATTTPAVAMTIAASKAVSAVGSITAQSGTAIPANGTAGAGLLVSATANFGIFFGSGAPTITAAQGSLYLRSDGSSTSTRLYVNTTGSTTWTNVTTAA